MTESPLALGQLTDIGDGRQIHHHECGTGPAVVFLHGSGPGASGLSNFGPNAQHLAANGFRALMPDLLGYGRSSMPADVSYHIDVFVDTLCAWMDALQIPQCAVVGNSMGGAVAIRLALRFPERVTRLVLMAPGGLEDREVYMQMRGIRRMLRCIYGPEGITLAGMHKVFELQVFDPLMLPTEPSDPSELGLIARRHAVAMTQPIEVFKTMQIPNQSDDLQNIACPVLGLWGMNDQFCPPSGATTLAAGCPDVRVVLLSRCGHWVMVEHRDRFNRLCTDFLKELL